MITIKQNGSYLADELASKKSQLDMVSGMLKDYDEFQIMDCDDSVESLKRGQVPVDSFQKVSRFGLEVVRRNIDVYENDLYFAIKSAIHPDGKRELSECASVGFLRRWIENLDQ